MRRLHEALLETFLVGELRSFGARHRDAEIMFMLDSSAWKVLMLVGRRIVAYR